MSLIINKVSSSSVQINYSFLDSDIVFGYEVVANYKIDFSDITYTNEQNVLFEGIEALRQAYQRKNLVARIGGDAFINGRIISQNFEESSLVGNSSCDITIQESKRSDFISGLDYKTQEFTNSIPSPQYVESFQETFNFSRSADTYSSSRNLSIKWKQDAGNQFLNNAKLFIKEFYFKNRPNFGYQVDGISENGRFDKNFRPLITETIDLLNLTVSLQENLETSFIENDYSKRQTYSIEVGADGYTQKRYSVEIKALKEPLETQAETACKSIIANIISENSSLGNPIEISKVLNKDGGVITLNISFSDNPFLNQSDTITYSVAKNKRGAFFDYELSVEIYSDGKNRTEKTQKTKTYWTQKRTEYPTIILTLFPEAGTIYELSRSTTFESTNGKIIDSVFYTDDDSYGNVGSGLLKLKFTNTIDDQVDRSSVFVDVVDKKQKIQVTENNLKTKGSGTYTMEAVAFKSSGLWFCYDNLKSRTFSISGKTIYITSDTISIDSRGATSRVISYDFI